MTAEMHDLRRARKRQPLPIPASATRIIGAFGSEQPYTGHDVIFNLRTTRKGVEVWLYATSGFSWNLSIMEGVWPQNFKEARKWVHAYAARFGQTVTEHRKEQTPRARKVDRVLLKEGKCKEEWLRSDVPALFAEACLRCNHAGGYCMSDGYCHYGDCDMIMEAATECVANPNSPAPEPHEA